MKPSLVASALTALINARQSAMLWGPPGVGKSEVVAQVAKKMKRQLIDLRLPLLDAVDLRGVPTVKDGKTVWIPPSFLPRNGKGILFFDEWPQAPQIVQNGGSSIILPPHTLGEYTLPEGWSCIAAGNRETDRAATQRMPSHIANRLVHLNYDVHLEDWVAWALQNDVEPAVIAFLNFRPELLHKFDPAVKAFPTPRSWGFVSNIMKQGVPDECFLETVSGTVGEGAATEFAGFFRVFRSLPDYEDICQHPDKAIVPDNAAALYAVTGMITHRGQSKDAKGLFQYIERLPRDFQVLCYRDLGKRNPDVCETQAYIRWATSNQAILLNH